MLLQLSHTSVEHGAPFGVFRAAPERDGAEGLHTASVPHLGLWLSDSTLLAGDSFALATTKTKTPAVQFQVVQTEEIRVRTAVSVTLMHGHGGSSAWIRIEHHGSMLRYLHVLCDCLYAAQGLLMQCC